jgi:hypothetical protein
MLIERDWLTGVIALVLGRQPGVALTDELAQVLEQREEVLPWLILRQGAFADDPAIMAVLHQHAAQISHAATRRPPAPPIAVDAITSDRALHGAMTQVIADAVAATALTSEIGALLHHHNQAIAGTHAYSFRRRIIEYPQPAISQQMEPTADLDE